MARVSFFSEKISFKLPNSKKTETWLLAVAKKENHRIESITYVFCSDSYLSRLNRDHLHHSTLTDILSFDFSESGSLGLQGEIYISVPRVKENARKYKQVFETELKRVMVHGLLHFMGYSDKTKDQKAQMRIKEEACLSLWK